MTGQRSVSDWAPRWEAALEAESWVSEVVLDCIINPAAVLVGKRVARWSAAAAAAPAERGDEGGDDVLNAGGGGGCWWGPCGRGRRG